MVFVFESATTLASPKLCVHNARVYYLSVVRMVSENPVDVVITLSTTNTFLLSLFSINYTPMFRGPYSIDEFTLVDNHTNHQTRSLKQKPLVSDQLSSLRYT